MSSRIIGPGALLAGISVALGAFGAHGLRDVLDDRAMAAFETAVRYQMYHSIALCLTGLFVSRAPSQKKLLHFAALLFAAGLTFFCGSLYVIVFSGVRIFGAVAPFGGLSFMAGWALFALAAFRSLE